MKRMVKGAAPELYREPPRSPAYMGGQPMQYPSATDGPRTTPALFEEPDLVIDARPEPAEEPISGPDDSLGLYLRQMGSIPLLNRNQELILARRLERARKRYRCAALWNWHVIGRVVDM